MAARGIIISLEIRTISIRNDIAIALKLASASRYAMQESSEHFVERQFFLDFHSYKLSVWIWSLQLQSWFQTWILNDKIFCFWREKKREKEISSKMPKDSVWPLCRSFVRFNYRRNQRCLVANTQEYILKFPDVKRQLLCWLISERDKNRQLLPWQKWISVRFEFKHDSNLKLRNAQLLE